MTNVIELHELGVISDVVAFWRPKSPISATRVTLSGDPKSAEVIIYGNFRDPSGIRSDYSSRKLLLYQNRVVSLLRARQFVILLLIFNFCTHFADLENCD